jgi:hypothetical protein
VDKKFNDATDRAIVFKQYIPLANEGKKSALGKEEEKKAAIPRRSEMPIGKKQPASETASGRKSLPFGRPTSG